MHASDERALGDAAQCEHGRAGGVWHLADSAEPRVVLGVPHRSQQRSLDVFVDADRGAEQAHGGLALEAAFSRVPLEGILRRVVARQHLALLLVGLEPELRGTEQQHPDGFLTRLVVVSEH